MHDFRGFRMMRNVYQQKHEYQLSIQIRCTLEPEREKSTYPKYFCLEKRFGYQK